MTADDIPEKPQGIFDRWNASRPDYESRKQEVPETPLTPEEAIHMQIFEQSQALYKRIKGFQEKTKQWRNELPLDADGNTENNEAQGWDHDAIEFQNGGFDYSTWNVPVLSFLGASQNRYTQKDANDFFFNRAHVSFQQKKDQSEPQITIQTIMNPAIIDLLQQMCQQSTDPEEAVAYYNAFLETRFTPHGKTTSKELSFWFRTEEMDKEDLATKIKEIGINKFKIKDAGEYEAIITMPDEIRREDIVLMGGLLGFLNNKLDVNFPPEEPRP